MDFLVRLMDMKCYYSSCKRETFGFAVSSTNAYSLFKRYINSGVGIGCYSLIVIILSIISVSNKYFPVAIVYNFVVFLILV